MIAEKTLRKWRKDALVRPKAPTDKDLQTHLLYVLAEQEERILRLTQELLDNHLIRKG